MIELNKIYHGKHQEVLKDFPDNYFDSCVADPPYGISFMNQHWDYDVPTVEDWKGILRVMKPGAHLLCACGTRTQHRMVVNIEDAGFEIRDIISWIYASGFPKSLNVNKYLDGQICNCKKEIPREQETEHNLRSMQQANISKEIFFNEAEGKILQSGLQEQDIHRTMQGYKAGEGAKIGKESSMEGGCNDVQEEGELQERGLCEGNRLDDPDGSKGRLHNATQNDNGEDVPKIINKDGSCTPRRSQPKQQQSGEPEIISNECDTQGDGAWENCSRCGKPILPDGIGTALKPATEFWTLARKPLSEKTVAANVLKWGTGGINIDGCRIEIDEDSDENFKARIGKTINANGVNDVFSKGMGKKTGDYFNSQGRFPANVIFDEFTGKILDEQTGELKSSYAMNREKNKNPYGGNSLNDSSTKHIDNNFGYFDTGGASRFFYCPKADNYERNKGLEKFTPIKVNDGREAEIDNAFQRGETLRKNTHPTVKPIDLMRYLVKLITPKKGICLDPYCGSGTTLIGCKLELINFIGIDKAENHCRIAEARVAAWNPDKYKAQTLF